MDMKDVQNYFLKMFTMPVKTEEITIEEIEEYERQNLRSDKE